MNAGLCRAAAGPPASSSIASSPAATHSSATPSRQSCRGSWCALARGRRRPCCPPAHLPTLAVAGRAITKHSLTPPCRPHGARACSTTRLSSSTPPGRTCPRAPRTSSGAASTRTPRRAQLRVCEQCACSHWRRALRLGEQLTAHRSPKPTAVAADAHHRQGGPGARVGARGRRGARAAASPGGAHPLQDVRGDAAAQEARSHAPRAPPPRGGDRGAAAHLRRHGRRRVRRALRGGARRRPAEARRAPRVAGRGGAAPRGAPALLLQSFSPFCVCSAHADLLFAASPDHTPAPLLPPHNR